MDFQGLHQFLDSVVNTRRLYNAGRCLQIFLEDLQFFEHLALEQKFGSVDILEIILDCLNEQVWDFPAEDDSGGQSGYFSISPGEVCGRVDFSKGGE